VDNA